MGGDTFPRHPDISCFACSLTFPPPSASVSPRAMSVSSQRVLPGSVNHKPCPWPASARDPDPDAASIAKQVIDDLNRALENANYEQLAGLFVEDGFWRDHLALSWALRTIKGRANIRTFLEAQHQLTR